MKGQKYIERILFWYLPTYVKWRQFCNLETNGISIAKFGHLNDKSFQFSSVTLPNNNKQQKSFNRTIKE